MQLFLFLIRLYDVCVEERELIHKVQKGDQKALGELYELHKDYVYNLAYQFFHRREPAEDVTQEVFVKFYFKAKRFRFESAFKTYLGRMTINQCRDIWRKQRRVVATDHSPAFFDPLPEESEEAVAVRRALAGLPQPYREVLVLKDVEELSVEEIGKIVGRKLGTVKSLLHRGRKLLREALVHGNR